MSGQKRLRASVRLIAKEDAIDHSLQWKALLFFRTSTTVQTFPPRRIGLPFCWNRELGWDIFNSFAGQLNAIEQKYQIFRSGPDGTYERKGAPPGRNAPLRSETELPATPTVSA
jgi:hypothetical protein